MTESNGTTPLGDNSIDKFSHHPYEVSQRINAYSVFGVQARAAQTEMVRKLLLSLLRITLLHFN